VLRLETGFAGLDNQALLMQSLIILGNLAEPNCHAWNYDLEKSALT
jgi:hypothetical protein